MNLHHLSRLADNIYYLDTRRENEFGVSGVYLIVADGITLIETGTSKTVPDILSAVKALGFQESDIKNVIVTHIHLDHAGGAGLLVRRIPGLNVYVHETGLNHLHNPTKLIESAKLVYGDLETIFSIHGDILPVPRENLIPVRNVKIDIGADIELVIFDAPGHANHHLCILDPATGNLFSGEALGHYEPRTGKLTPAVAPPAFDFEKSIETIHRISALSPKLICFSQFGYRHDAKVAIAEALGQLQYYYDTILSELKKNITSDDIILKMISSNFMGNHVDELSQSMLVSIVVGYEVYFKRKNLI